MRSLPVAALALLLPPLLAIAQPYERSLRYGGYSVTLLDESGGLLPTFEQGGRFYVLGQKGQRYLIRVNNQSWSRVEVVVSVDGRDVLDGKPADSQKRGYLVDAHGEVVIDGFRLSEASVAAFRFGSVSSSYASRMGDARDVGVIGVAVFPERAPRYRPPPPPPPPWWRDGPVAEGEYQRRSNDSMSGSAAGVAPESPAAGAPPSPQPPATHSPSEPKVATKKGPVAQERPGLGTDFGEEHGSQVYLVNFERESSRPAAVLSLRYNDREGLRAIGIDVDGLRPAVEDAWLRESAEPFRSETSGYSQPPPGWRP